jgi:hypothetical protein
VCPARQTTGDFLTSLTNPSERIIAEGFENRVPRTADEFARVWKESTEYQALLKDIAAYNADFPLGGEALSKFRTSRQLQQSKSMCVNAACAVDVIVLTSLTGARSRPTPSLFAGRLLCAWSVASSGCGTISPTFMLLSVSLHPLRCRRA